MLSTLRIQLSGLKLVIVLVTVLVLVSVKPPQCEMNRFNDIIYDSRDNILIAIGTGRDER